MQSSGVPRNLRRSHPFRPFGPVPLVSSKGSLGRIRIHQSHLHPQRQHFNPLLFGAADSSGSAAGGAVVDGDEQLRAAEHFVVAPEHAAGAIVILQHLNLIAGGEQSPIARAGRSIPSVRLRRAWDERTQPRVLRAICPCGQDGLGKILVAAAGHTAQEGMKAPVIDLPHRAAQERLECGTARIIFVPPPWQALRPVAGKERRSQAFTLFPVYFPQYIRKIASLQAACTVLL